MFHILMFMLFYILYICYHMFSIILEWEMFQTEDVEKIKTHILCSILLFF
jgi:hypothetical protein